MKFHPLADVFPLIEGADFDELVASVRASGQREDIILFEGAILDGRNRWRACIAAGVEPRFKNFIGADPVRFVMDTNLCRRHLTEAQRGMAGGKLANILNGSNQYKYQTVKVGVVETTPTQITTTDAANIVGVDRSTVQSAKVVLERGTPDEIRAVENGEVGLRTMANEIRKKTTPPTRTSRGNSKNASVKRAENVRIRVELWAHLSSIFDHLHNLPRPQDVVAQMRAHGRSSPINRDLPRALRWLEEFSNAWNAETPTDREGHEAQVDREGDDDAGHGDATPRTQQDQSAA